MQSFAETIQNAIFIDSKMYAGWPALRSFWQSVCLYAKRSRYHGIAHYHVVKTSRRTWNWWWRKESKTVSCCCSPNGTDSSDSRRCTCSCRCHVQVQRRCYKQHGQHSPTPRRCKDYTRQCCCWLCEQVSSRFAKWTTVAIYSQRIFKLYFWPTSAFWWVVGNKRD